VDKLLKQIGGFMADIADDFKIVVVDAIRSLCLKFPSKHRSLMNFLSGALREEGGFDYKKSIVNSILMLIRVSGGPGRWGAGLGMGAPAGSCAPCLHVCCAVCIEGWRAGWLACSWAGEAGVYRGASTSAMLPICLPCCVLACQQRVVHGWDACWHVEQPPCVCLAADLQLFLHAAPPGRTSRMRARRAWPTCVSSLRTASSPSSAWRCCTCWAGRGPLPRSRHGEAGRRLGCRGAGRWLRVA
jgi:hypothetical protein